MKVEFYGQLWKQMRDDEDEITMTLKCPASEFVKVIGIPTRTLLQVTIQDVNAPVDSHGDKGGEAESE